MKPRAKPAGCKSKKAGGANNLPKLARVGRLDTFPRLFKEMQRKYKQAAAGLIGTQDLTRYVYALSQMQEALFKHEALERLESLERAASISQLTQRERQTQQQVSNAFN